MAAILVIADTIALRVLSRTILEHTGHRVREAYPWEGRDS
jgi:hypothetical protein